MKLLTYEDAAESCQMSVAWIRKQARAGKLVVVRFGRHPRIRQQDLEEFVRTCLPATVQNQENWFMQLAEKKVSFGQ
jgi:excisionase family DNA binding protein